MKKLLLISFLIFVFAGTGFSQRGERIESFRIAFLTEKLNLTPTESQGFWPIYNEMRAELKELKGDEFRARKIHQMTDTEADAFIQKSFDIEQKQLDIKRAYYGKLRNVLPPQKIARLPKAEQQFKKKLLQEMRQRRKNRDRF